MTKQLFAERVARELNGTVKTTEKANGIVLTGVVVGDGSLRAVYYIDDYYDRGDNINDAVECIKRDISERDVPTLNIDSIVIFEDIKDKIRARLYNAKTNAEVYKSAKEYGFSDLIIVPYIENIISNGSIRITQGLLHTWNKTAEEVIEIGMENCKNDGYEIENISDLLRMISAVRGYELDIPDLPDLFVLTNKNKMFGSIGAIIMKDVLKEKFSTYAVIPSSIHEVLIYSTILEDNQMTKMNDLINSVNNTNVSPEDYLGSSAYLF